MKKLTRIIPILAATMIIAISCNNAASSSDPKAVLLEFFKRLEKKDIDGASKLTSKASESTMSMMKKGLEMSEKMGEKEKKDDEIVGSIDDLEIGEAKIDGDNATVPFKNKKENVSFDFPLVKEGGAWKVDFSMATLMKMGKNGMNGADTNDGTDYDMDGQKSLDTLMNNSDVNMDSLTKSLEELKKMADPEKMKEMMKELEKLKEQN